MKAGARRGVTLIETLVVLALIALLASIAVLGAPAARSSAREEAERFAARLDRAQAHALATGAPLKVDIAANGYAFSAYRDSAWAELKSPAALARRAFRRDVSVSIVSIDASLADKEPTTGSQQSELSHFIVDPLGGGETSVAFADRGGRWIVSADRVGSVKVARDGG